MRQTNRHITISNRSSRMSWLLLSLLLLCLSACSSSDDDNSQPTNPSKAPTQLYIYVYAPQQAEPTRATYEGDVSAVNQEATIYSMQIWVFTHDTKKLIGYYSPTTLPGLSSDHPYKEFQLTIDETYAETEVNSRENVDVYVLANVTPETCNVTLNETTTQAQLEAAVMSKTNALDPFGMATPVTSVPENVGLPMSGVLRDQPVTGSSPVLRLESGDELAKVILRRTISKLRFAFSRETGSETLRINSIQLNTEMIPLSEYLFMTDAQPYDRKTCHIGTEYDATTSNLLLDVAIPDVAERDDPAYYAWGNSELDPFHYEWLIEAAVSDGYLTQRTFYLRESDKLLQGTIKYQIGEGEEQTTTFRMIDEGGFSRNHVWTVYAYQANAKLQVVVATVTAWRQIEEEYDFYNW